MTAGAPAAGSRGWRSLEVEVAFRAAVAAVVPLAILVLVGRPDLAPYAAFGGMAAIFGRGERYRVRARTVIVAATGLVVSVAAGTALAAASAPLWVEAIVLVAVIAGGVVVVNAAPLSPPTTLFFVFGLLVCAQVPTPAGEVVLRIGIAVVSAAFAVALTLSGWLLRRFGSEATRAVLKDLPRAPVPRPGAVRDPRVWLSVGQNGAGALVAGALALAFGPGHPYWAVVSVIAVVPPAGAAHSLSRAVHRVLGTVGGVVVAALVLWPAPPVWLLVLVVGVAQFGAEILVGRHYGAALLCITPLALVVAWIAAPVDLGGLVADRVIETVIGCAVGVAVVLAGSAVARRFGGRAGVAG